MAKVYRKGAIGALMDEYERAVEELKLIINQVSESDYEKIFDAETTNENCRSIQNIISHVISACYGYADAIREVFVIDGAINEEKQLSKQEAILKLGEAIKYTVETLEGKWQMPGSEIMTTYMKGEYVENLEQILEHAIVHILRHRRQIEKFLANS
jgi:uncharacterized damage-inducible protein DinB